jgi:Winged helix domain, variant/ATPase family associated with various cellular activities (AAA)
MALTTEASTQPLDPSLLHLLGRLAVIEDRVHFAVDRFRAVDPTPDDGFRGLYVSDDQADALLADGRRLLPHLLRADQRHTGVEADADRAEAAGHTLRLRELQTEFALTAIDVEILLAALAPDLDQRYERLYGYLHDDVTRRRASPGLALQLAGCSELDADARAHVTPGAALFRHDLVILEDAGRSFLTRSLRVPDRVSGHLLGDDRPDGSLLEVIRSAVPVPSDLAERLTRALVAAHRVFHLRQRSDFGAEGAAAAALAATGREALFVDLAGVAEIADLEAMLGAASREARLCQAGLIVQGVDELHAWAIRRLADAGSVVFLIGRGPWDPSWSTAVPHREDVDPAEAAERERWWDEATGALEVDVSALGGLQLGPAAIRRSVVAATARAHALGETLSPQHLATGARDQNSVGLERLARRVTPSVGWADMVLQVDTLTQLRHLAARVSQRTKVLDEWGLRRGGGRGEGITALFSGESGTGKTMAAEVIASELALDMYVIDLSTVVDKYIGETEKNLEKIFTEAEGINGVLFFDEADALFGNRSEVSDAKDRYANVEVAYLLQRMEAFDGLAVLASNLKSNIDEAFARRISVTVDFAMPEPPERSQLWKYHTDKLPVAADVDLEFLAERFELSGGNIRNVAVSAAYLAADDGSEVTMSHLIRGTLIEYRKLGRLTVEAEFGGWLDAVKHSSGTP